MPKVLLSLLFLLAVLLAPVNMPSATAEEEQGKRIVSIDVRGNRYVETETVLVQVRTKVGENLSRKKVSRDVRRLFDTGFFSDVRVIGEPDSDGIRLFYEVTENPLVAEVKILGNDEIPAKDMKLRLKIKPGRVLNDTSRMADTQTIRKAYLKKGYYQVDVDIQTKERKDGRIDVSINVTEGEITRIKRIRFVGNQAFSDQDLLDITASRQSDLISWFNSRDVFDRERLLGDAQLINQHYLNRGYLDAKIESSLISLSPDKLWFFLTFNIYEGPQYTVSTIDIQGDLVPDHDTLREGVVLESGELYSLEKLIESIEAVTTVVGDEGYAFANITPLFHRDIQARTVDITLDVEKGREVYIERIEISGNVKSDDSVVRRELRQIEGERYATSKVERSKKRLARSQLFEDTRVSFPKGKSPSMVRMKLDLEERKTGSFSLGVGFSQLEKSFFTGRVSEQNVMGKGINARVDGQVGVKTQNFNTSLTDPYFLDKELSASINAFKRQTRLQEIVAYKQNSFGGGVDFGISLTEFLTYYIGYQFTEVNLLDIPANSSSTLLSQFGKQQTGEFSNTLAWDTRNNTLAPTDGHFERLRVGVAGLAGQNRFLEMSASSKIYFPLGGDFVLNPSVEGRYIRGYSGKDVPIYRRYSLGGVGSLRGFDYFGVTVRDAATNDVLGGNKEFTASLNLYFPMPYMQTKGFRGVLFTDAGNVADLSQRLSLSDTRVSLGFGVEWLSPVGPVGLIWGFPLRKKAGDIAKSFEFSLGSVF